MASETCSRGDYKSIFSGPEIDEILLKAKLALQGDYTVFLNLNLVAKGEPDENGDTAYDVTNSLEELQEFMSMFLSSADNSQWVINRPLENIQIYSVDTRVMDRTTENVSLLLTANESVVDSTYNRKQIVVTVLYNIVTKAVQTTAKTQWLLPKLVQEEGDSTKFTMSQKAITDSFIEERRVREEADIALGERIDQEIKDRAEADKVLQQNIDAEAKAREDADIALGKRIDQEVEDRQSGDTQTLASAKEYADGLREASVRDIQGLQNQIDSINQAITQLGQDLSNLSDLLRDDYYTKIDSDGRFVPLEGDSVINGNIKAITMSEI